MMESVCNVESACNKMKVLIRNIKLYGKTDEEKKDTNDNINLLLSEIKFIKKCNKRSAAEMALLEKDKNNLTTINKWLTKKHQQKRVKIHKMIQNYDEYFKSVKNYKFCVQCKCYLFDDEFFKQCNDCFVEYCKDCYVIHVDNHQNVNYLF